MKPKRPDEPKSKQLSSKVVDAMLELGAVRSATPLDRHIEGVDDKDLPPPIRELIQDFKWPDGAEYAAEAGDNDNEVDIWCADFSCDPLETCDDFEGAEELALVMIGIYDGGNFTLAVSLKDKTPSDPKVYSVDQEDPDEKPESLGRLSAFLARLEREA